MPHSSNEKATPTLSPPWPYPRSSVVLYYINDKYKTVFLSPDILSKLRTPHGAWRAFVCACQKMWLYSDGIFLKVCDVN